MLLARLKDPRAAPIAALQLSHFFKRRQAVRVLETLGPLAEKDVAVYLSHADLTTRMEACRADSPTGWVPVSSLENDKTSFSNTGPT